MFFTYLNQVLSPGVDVNLTVSKTADGNLTVLVMPKVHDLKDPAQHRIGSLSLRGTPAELDQQFFPSITAPVQKTSGILLNLQEYEKQQEAATANSKSAKDAKTKTDKAANDKKTKYDGYMKKADEHEAAGNLDGALTQLAQARLHGTEKEQKTVDEKIAAIKAKTSQPDLFEVPSAAPESVPAAPQPTATTQPATAETTAPTPQPEPTPAVSEPVAAATSAPSQPTAMPAQVAPPQTSAPLYREYDSAPRPADGRYPTHRESEYDKYPDFIPPTGGGMGAPLF